jgi:hypothetical protein
MKKIFGCLLFASLVSIVSSQQLYLEAGKVISSFDYKNSDGNSPGDLTGTFQNNLGVGTRISVLKSPWHISPGVAYNKYGAKSSDQELGNYSEWEGTYLGVNLGVDYEFLKPPMTNADRDGFSFYVRGIFETDFLLNGSQRNNNQVFDLAGVEEFDKPVYFLKGGAGVNYYITRSYVAFAQYTYGRSILFGNYSGREQLRFITHCVSIGFSVSLYYDRK